MATQKNPSAVQINPVQVSRKLTCALKQNKGCVRRLGNLAERADTQWGTFSGAEAAVQALVFIGFYAAFSLSLRCR